MGERIRTAWKSGSATRRRLSGLAWSMVAFLCASLMRGLRGLAAGFEGAARLIRSGAGRLERAAAGARARTTLAPAEDQPAASPEPAPASDKTIVSRPSADQTIVAAPAFLAALPPALPPPRPQWGRGPVLPPPRRAEWRSALEAKRPSGAVPQEPQASDTTDGLT